jgi:hypothetical protein
MHSPLLLYMFILLKENQVNIELYFAIGVSGRKISAYWNKYIIIYNEKDFKLIV